MTHEAEQSKKYFIRTKDGRLLEIGDEDTPAEILAARAGIVPCFQGLEEFEESFWEQFFQPETTPELQTTI